MSWIASLPIYDLPELRAANARFWSALARILREEWIADVPGELDCGAGDVRFTQVCGFPLRTDFAGRYVIVGTPTYDVPGCEQSSHRAFIVVRADAPFGELADLRGRTFAVNDPRSNTGMNLPRRLFAEIARGAPFFGDVRLTGSHAASAALVSDGGADVASIDCVTYALLREHQPRAVSNLRVLAQTKSSPAIPFVTTAESTTEFVEALRRGLARLGRDERFASDRAGLRIRSIRTLPEGDYDVLLAYEREAIALGYPTLR